MFDIISLKVCPAINRFESEEDAKSGHPLNQYHVKHPIIDQSLGRNPHPPSKILAVGHCHKIRASRIEFLPITKNLYSLRSILHECGNRGSEKSQRSTAACPVHPVIHLAADTNAGDVEKYSGGWLPVCSHIQIFNPPEVATNRTSMSQLVHRLIGIIRHTQ
jgi:hypothetical protein